MHGYLGDIFTSDSTWSKADYYIRPIFFTIKKKGSKTKKKTGHSFYNLKNTFRLRGTDLNMYSAFSLSSEVNRKDFCFQPWWQQFCIPNLNNYSKQIIWGNYFLILANRQHKSVLIIHMVSPTIILTFWLRRLHQTVMEYRTQVRLSVLTGTGHQNEVQGCRHGRSLWGRIICRKGAMQRRSTRNLQRSLLKSLVK